MVLCAVTLFPLLIKGVLDRETKACKPSLQLELKGYSAATATAT